MNFPYQPVFAQSPETGESQVIHRPEIPVMVMGRTDAAWIVGLVDTGSDNTILPRSIPDDLGIALTTVSGPQAKAFDGQELPLLVGDARLCIQVEQETFHGKSRLLFYDFPRTEDETVILGHAGFLDHFTATFDGKRKTLELVTHEPSAISET